MLTLFDIVKNFVDELGLDVIWDIGDDSIEPETHITKKSIIVTMRTAKGNNFQTRVGIFVDNGKFGIYGDHNVTMSWNPADPKAFDEFRQYLITKHFDHTQIKTDDSPKYKYYPY